MSADVLRIVADDYRVRGPMQHGVRARDLLDLSDAETLGTALELLIEQKAVVARPDGVLTLCPQLKLSVLTRPVIDHWVGSARSVGEGPGDLLIAAIRMELRTLIRWVTEQPPSDDLIDRAVGLAGVLAMKTLDTEAMTIVAGYRGTPAQRLRDVVAIPEGSCLSLNQLRASLSRNVTSTFVGD